MYWSGGFDGIFASRGWRGWKKILPASLKRRLNEIYAKHTGQKLSVIEKAMERDNFMSPEKAKEFGLIDEVISKRPE